MYAIRNAQDNTFFQGLDARQDATYGPAIIQSTPTWSDFEECQSYILITGLTLCEVYTIP
jgi:hypothetical protein